MKLYIKFIKKFHLPLIALSLLGLIYFGVNGVKAEFSTKKEKPQENNLAERPLNIVAVDDNQTQNVVSPSPSQTPKPTQILETPEVKNIPAVVAETPKTKITMRINAGSAAGNYPIDYIDSENTYQLLIKIAQKNHFSVKTKNYSWGIFVEGIGNLVQDGKDNFWFLYINGKTSEVGATDYLVKPNDLIEWRYHEYWIY